MKRTIGQVAKWLGISAGVLFLGLSINVIVDQDNSQDHPAYPVTYDHLSSFKEAYEEALLSGKFTREELDKIKEAELLHQSDDLEYLNMLTVFEMKIDERLGR